MSYTGPDLSSFQAGVNLGAVRRAGHSFVIVKASQGVNYTNPYFATHVAQAKAVGLIASAYHFLDGSDGRAQGQHFVATLVRAGVMPGSVRVWADFEAYPSSNPTHAVLHTFLQTVEAAGYTTGIYSASFYWDPMPGTWGCTTCAQKPLWQAAYSSRRPNPLQPWTRAALWQFTDRSPTVPGYSLDMSVTDDLAVFAVPQPKPAPITGAPVALTAADYATFSPGIRKDMLEVGAQVLRGEGVSGAAQQFQVLAGKLDALALQVTALQKTVDALKAQA